MRALLAFVCCLGMSASACGPGDAGDGVGSGGESTGGAAPNDASGGAGGGGPSAGGTASGGASDGGEESGGSSSGGGSSASGGSGDGGSDSCTPEIECEPEPLPATDDPVQDCVDRINQFRVGCWCLPALQRWTEGEECAEEQSEYDAAADRAHAGFSDGICPRAESGWAQNECPGWGSEEHIVSDCLQMMYDEGPPPSEPCEGQCFQTHGHFINMTNPDYTKVACGFFTTAEGDVWSVQNFSN